MSQLDNGDIFLGCGERDSIIARIRPDSDEQMDIMHRFHSTDSLFAMIFVKPGKGTGTSKLNQGCTIDSFSSEVHASLGIMHGCSGVMMEKMKVGLQNVHHLWVLKCSHGHAVLVASNRGHIETFLIPEVGSLTTSKIIPEGFDQTTSTICCCEIGGTAIQVTPRGAFEFSTIAHSTRFRIKKRAWRPGSGRVITATGNGEFLAIAVSVGLLVSYSPFVTEALQ
jgi:hypothetical protein